MGYRTRNYRTVRGTVPTGNKSAVIFGKRFLSEVIQVIHRLKYSGTGTGVARVADPVHFRPDPDPAIKI